MYSCHLLTNGKFYFQGVGNFVFPPIVQLLIEHFGWRGCILILAGITLNCAVFGSLFRPVKQKQVEQLESEQVYQKPLLIRIKEARAAQWSQSDETLNEDSPTGSQNSAPPPYSEVLNIIRLTETNDLVPVSNKTEDNQYRRRTKSALERKGSTSRDEMLYSNLSLVVLPQSRSISNLNQCSNNRDESNTNNKETEDVEVKSSVCSGFDLSLFKRPSFILLAISGFLCLVGFFIPFIYLSDRAKLLGKK